MFSRFIPLHRSCCLEPPILARTPGSALDVLLTVLTGMVGSPEGNEVLSVGFVRQVLALCYSLMWGGHQARCAPIMGGMSWT